MAERVVTPEILPPGEEWPPRGSSEERLPLDLVALRHFAVLLDEAWEIPGTKRRIGLDAGLGLIPVVGDGIAAMMSLFIVVGALRHRVPLPKVARMIANILLDVLVGAIPLVGDVVDFLWKENLENVDLIVRHRNRNLPPRKVHEIAASVVFLVIVFVILLLLVMGLAVAGIVWLIRIGTGH